MHASECLFYLFCWFIFFFTVGQGVVVVRTPYGDPVFARALHQAGFVSEACK